MWSKPKTPGAINRIRKTGEEPYRPSPRPLIGMSLRQDIPGELLSSRARFRFSCHDHSEPQDPRCQQKSSEQRSVPTSRVSKLDTSRFYRLVPSVPRLFHAAGKPNSCRFNPVPIVPSVPCS